jgi:hypothetical protein
MGALRVLVADVDEALPVWEAAGYTVTQRWGPPFAILTAAGMPDLWLSGPGTSAEQAVATLSVYERDCAAVHPVLEVDDLHATVARLADAGWEPVDAAVTGPGGSQMLLHQGTVFLEVFTAS